MGTKTNSIAAAEAQQHTQFGSYNWNCHFRPRPATRLYTVKLLFVGVKVCKDQLYIWDARGKGNARHGIILAIMLHLLLYNNSTITMERGYGRGVLWTWASMC